MWGDPSVDHGDPSMPYKYDMQPSHSRNNHSQSHSRVLQGLLQGPGSMFSRIEMSLFGICLDHRTTADGEAAASPSG